MGGGAASSKKAAPAAALDDMTRVQSLTFEGIRAGKDMVVRAPTGSGKTLAFVVPVVEGLHPDQGLSVLVMCPLRLLANQISTVFRRFCDPKGMTVLTLVGGGESQSDVRALQDPGSVAHVLVATPGVLRASLSNPEAKRKMSSVRTVVIDEAHRMLDPSFMGVMREILAATSKDRQTLMFSATLSDEITRSEFLRADSVTVVDASEGAAGDLSSPDAAVSTVDQYAIVRDVASHPSVVAAVLQKHAAAMTAMKGGGSKKPPEKYSNVDLSDATKEVLSTWWGSKSDASASSWKAMVFVQGNAYVDVFARALSARLQNVFCVHGDKRQKDRVRESDRFRDTPESVLVTSDASAMGMDYEGVTLVIQVGFTNRRDYIQRLGRTGRAGARGTNVVLIDPAEAHHVTTELAMKESAPTPDLVPSDDDVTGSAVDVTAVAKPGDRKRAYRSWLGFLASHMKAFRLSGAAATDYAKRFSKGMGLGEPDEAVIKAKLHIRGP